MFHSRTTLKNLDFASKVKEFSITGFEAELLCGIGEKMVS
jgi:hypothetical protein